MLGDAEPDSDHPMWLSEKALQHCSTGGISTYFIIFQPSIHVVYIGLYWFILVYIGLWHCFTRFTNMKIDEWHAHTHTITDTWWQPRANVIRSKGFCWLEQEPSTRIYWSHVALPAICCVFQGRFLGPQICLAMMGLSGNQVPHSILWFIIIFPVKWSKLGGYAPIFRDTYRMTIPPGDIWRLGRTWNFPTLESGGAPWLRSRLEPSMSRDPEPWEYFAVLYRCYYCHCQSSLSCSCCCYYYYYHYDTCHHYHFSYPWWLSWDAGEGDGAFGGRWIRTGTEGGRPCRRWVQRDFDSSWYPYDWGCKSLIGDEYELF